MFTEEQKQVIEHRGDARVNAVAGSGKTSTLVGYAQARPSQRILYLAFNRSVRLEAERKFREAGCPNVRVETAHSLAYRMMDVRRRFKIFPGGSLRISDIVDLCGLTPFGRDTQAHLVKARHISNLLSMFCNAACVSFSEVDYLATLTDAGAQDFVRKHLDEIYGHARFLMSEMHRGHIPLTHDAYLKFFQLTYPALPFDAICFDEGQDASPVMLDVFLRQSSACKVIVGDAHQSIYGFRSAVNSLAQVDFPEFQLATSFRFRQEVADLAMRSLSLKRMIKGSNLPAMQIRGVGESQGREGYAVLARTNHRLLKAAINAIAHDGYSRLYFEGGLENYTYMSEGASLFDVLNLCLGQTGRIRSPFIRSFGDFWALKEYIRATEDGELRLVAEIVEEYGPALFDYMRRIKELQVEREAAEIIFSTVHKAKGQEYDLVELCEDFIDGQKIEALLAMAKKSPEKKAIDADALSEEIHALYVAITRAKNILMMPFDVLHGDEGEADFYVFDGTSEKQAG